MPPRYSGALIGSEVVTEVTFPFFSAARLRKVHRRQSAVCTGSADDESV